MRIGQIGHASIGGSARVAVELGRALAGRGHAVHFFAANPVGGISGTSMMLHTLSRGSNGALSPHLEKDWPEQRIDAFVDMLASATSSARLEVAHFHYALPFARVAARLRAMLPVGECPLLVMTLHGTDVSELDAAEARRMSDVLSAFDVLTTVSWSHASLVAERLGVAAPVIPNFVDLNRFRPPSAAADLWRSTRRRARIAHVSNFRPIKNSDAAARVFADVVSHLDAELWLIGDGELLPSVRGILHAHRLLDRVRFCGLRLDVHRFLPRTDLLLVTSHTESFCLAAVEALACGVPVVAPRVGGLPEVVAHGSTGILFCPGDEEAASWAVRRILSDARLLLSMRQAARRSACLFASNIVVQRYERLYRWAVRGDVETREPRGESALPGARADFVPVAVSAEYACVP
jgi:L-malate glycosyltransferase